MNLTAEALLALQNEIDDLNIEQHALKILINSGYGALANKHFLLANPDMAAAITSSGRFFIRLLGQNIENRLQGLLASNKPYVIYNDTDSCYFQIEPIAVKKLQNPSSDEIVDFCNAFYDKVIEEVIQATIAEFSELLNVWDSSVIGVGREIIADVAVWSAKKKYFARVLDMEGVRHTEHPYIKIMGIEIAKSSTPEWCKQKLYEAIDVILDGDAQSLRRWRDKVKKEFQGQPIETISMTSGVSSLAYKLTDSGVPQGSRSALVHNAFVEREGLMDEIELLKPGEKYKRCYLKTPNPFGDEIISWGDSKIAEMIQRWGCFDYSKNFEKYFEQPLENMIKLLNWNIKGVAFDLDF